MRKVFVLFSCRFYSRDPKSFSTASFMHRSDITRVNINIWIIINPDECEGKKKKEKP